MPRYLIASLSLLSALCVLPGCMGALEKESRSELDRELRELKIRGRNIIEKNEQSQIKLPANPKITYYLRYGALHNPGLRAAFYRWQAALEKAPQARALPDPRFSYTRYIEEVETRVGPQKNKFSLMQMLPWPAKLLSKSDMAVRNALVARHLYEVIKLNLFYRIRKTYYEYYYLHRSSKILAENISLLKNIENTIRSRYKANIAKNPSLIQTQVEIGRLEDRLNSLIDLQPALASRINEAIGRKPFLPLPWPKNISLDVPDLKADDLLKKLLQESPALKAAKERIQAAKAGKRLAKANYFPDLGIGATVVDTGRRTDTNMNIQGNGKDPVMLMFEMSLPIWFNKYNAGLREAKARLGAAKNMFAEQTNKLSADLRLTLFHFDDAKRKLSLFRNSLIPKAEQALAASRVAFSAEKASFTDMLDTERSLLELRLMGDRALVNQNIRLAELEMLCGQELRGKKQEKIAK